MERLQALRTSGARPLAARLELWPLPDPFEHSEPAVVWSLLRAAIRWPLAAGLVALPCRG